MQKPKTSLLKNPYTFVYFFFALWLILVMVLLTLVFFDASIISIAAVSAFFLLSLVGGIIYWTRVIYTPLARLKQNVDKIKHAGAKDREASITQSSDDNSNFIDHLQEVFENEYENLLLKTKAEMHALQSQINPHFLYNTLEAIRNQALQRDADEIADMAEALATLFRYSISRPGDLATFGEELDNIDNYLLIQQFRFRGKFNVVKIFDEDDSNLVNYRLPVLTIQPIIENAIHHGLETKTGTGIVTIRAFTTQSKLVISISDDGVGMSSQTLSELTARFNENVNSLSEDDRYNTRGRGHGIAILNVHRRIKLYFGDEYGLFITSTQGIGTTVEIQLPKIYDTKAVLEDTK